MNSRTLETKLVQGYSELRAQFVQFLQWWRKELTGLLPKQFSRLHVSKMHPAVILQDTGETLNIYYKQGQTCEYKGAVDYRTGMPLTMEDQLQSLLAGDYASMQPVLCIAAKNVVNKLITLPKAAQENLVNVLRYELDRHTPFDTAQAYFDYSVVKEDTAAGLIVVSLRVLPRDYVDNLAVKLKHSISWPPIIVITDDISDCENWEKLTPFRLSGHSAGDSDNVASRINLWLSVVVCLLLAAVLIVPLAKMDNAVDGLRSQLTGLRKQLQEVEATRGEINTIIQELQSLKQKKDQSKNVVDVILEITRLLPDDTWLESFEVKQGRIVIQGQSSSASALIALIEASPVFEKVTFQSPVVQNQGDDFERFIIVAQFSNQAVQDG